MDFADINQHKFTIIEAMILIIRKEVILCNWYFVAILLRLVYLLSKVALFYTAKLQNLWDRIPITSSEIIVVYISNYLNICIFHTCSITRKMAIRHIYGLFIKKLPTHTLVPEARKIEYETEMYMYLFERNCL